MKSVLLFVILLGFTFASSDPLVIEIQLYVDVACNMLNQTQEVPVGVCMSIPALDNVSFKWTVVSDIATLNEYLDSEICTGQAVQHTFYKDACASDEANNNSKVVTWGSANTATPTILTLILLLIFLVY